MPDDDHEPLERLGWFYWDHGLAFGLFPDWERYQDFRCWRDWVLIPAARRFWREIRCG